MVEHLTLTEKMQLKGSSPAGGSKLCEHCDNYHDGDYGSGRFCSENCSKTYSTLHNKNHKNERRKRSKLWKIPDNEFIILVKSCQNYTDVCNKLGFDKAAGYVLHIVKLRCKRLNVTHLVQLRYRKRDNFLKSVECYDNRSAFRRRIIRDRLIPYECAGCSNKGHWLGKEMALQLHHKNGDPKDHRLDNVEFLCPNCHAITPNWTGRNKKNK